MLDHEHDAIQVDAQDLAPVVRIKCCLESARNGKPRDSGGKHHDIETPERGDALLDGGLAIFLARDVGDAVCRTGTGCLDLLDRPLQLVLATGREKHLGTVLGEDLCRLVPDSTGARAVMRATRPVRSKGSFISIAFPLHVLVIWVHVDSRTPRCSSRETKGHARASGPPARHLQRWAKWPVYSICNDSELGTMPGQLEPLGAFGEHITIIRTRSAQIRRFVSSPGIRPWSMARTSISRTARHLLV